MLNAKLNKKFHDYRDIFIQYSQLINSINNDEIPKQFKSEITHAQINFLLFSLNSLIQSVSQYGADSQTQLLMRSNIDDIQDLLRETDSTNPQQCVKQLEKAIETWPEICG